MDRREGHDTGMTGAKNPNMNLTENHDEALIVQEEPESKSHDDSTTELENTHTHTHTHTHTREDHDHHLPSPGSGSGLGVWCVDGLSLSLVKHSQRTGS